MEKVEEVDEGTRMFVSDISRRNEMDTFKNTLVTYILLSVRVTEDFHTENFYFGIFTYVFS